MLPNHILEAYTSYIHRQPSSRTHSHTTQHERPQQINRYKNTWYKTGLPRQRYENLGSLKRRQHNRHPNEELTTPPTPKTLFPPTHICPQNQTWKERHHTNQQLHRTHLKSQPRHPHPKPRPSRSSSETGESRAVAGKATTPSSTNENNPQNVDNREP